jgi:DNA-binding transcriptional MerR regulator
MAAKPISIGKLARDAGCKAQTVRWYEAVGLMPKPGRTPGNQRIYGPGHANRLAFIRHARELGFPLEDIRELLEMADGPDHPSCDAVDSVAHRHLHAVQSRIERLQGLEAELQRMIEECRGGRVSNCRIIEVLSDHSHAHCLSEDHGRDSVNEN